MTTRPRTTPPPALAVTYLDEDLAVFEWAPEEAGPRSAPPAVANPAAAPAEPSLTAAERDVLAAIARGASNAAIAAARRTSIRTVANQVATLLRKLGATSRYELIKRHGLKQG